MNNYYIRNSFDYEINYDFNQLLKYLNNSNYYNLINKSKNNKEKRINNSKILGEIGDTSIFYKYIPNRKIYEVNKDSNRLDNIIEKKCILCLSTQANKKIDPINNVRSILWRQYLITPNTFPYFKDHMLILSIDHNHGLDGDIGSQNVLHLKNHVINDMIDLYVLLGQKGTMFFNGLIGNSQIHFHFHKISETIPIQNLLNTNNEYDISFENVEILNTKKIVK